MNSVTKIVTLSLIISGLNIFAFPVLSSSEKLCGNTNEMHVRLPKIGPGVFSFKAQYAENVGNLRVALCKRSSIGELGFLFRCTRETSHASDNAIFNVPGKIIENEGNFVVTINDVVFYPDSKVTQIQCVNIMK